MATHAAVVLALPQRPWRWGLKTSACRAWGTRPLPLTLPTDLGPGNAGSSKASLTSLVSGMFLGLSEPQVNEILSSLRSTPLRGMVYGLQSTGQPPGEGPVHRPGVFQGSPWARLLLKSDLHRRGLGGISGLPGPAPTPGLPMLHPGGPVESEQAF